MTQDFEELPYGPIRSAMETIFGRFATYLLACIIGCGVGSMIAGGESGSLFSGIIGSPLIFYSSFLFSQGLWVWPLVILLGGLYLRLGLPHWILVFPAVAATWLSFSVVKHVNNQMENSPFGALSSERQTQEAEQDVPPNA